MKQHLAAFAAVSLFAVASALPMACSNSANDAAANKDSSTANAMTASTNKTEKNRATALACNQGFNAHDVNAICKDFAPDVADYGDGSMSVVRGLDSAKSGIARFLNSFPDLKGENFMTLADGNRVAVFGDWSGTFKVKMGGMKPTGKSFKIKDVDLYTFNDQGQITQHSSVQATTTVLAQLGVKMK